MILTLSGLQLTAGIALVPVTVYVLYNHWQQRKRSKGLPLPPGPRGWPIIGNALDIPLESMAPVYAQWAKDFNSDIISASALGTTLVVIDKYDTAIELLEKRATKYSSRAKSVMATDLMGYDSFILSPNLDAWKVQRKLFVRYFRPNGGVHISQEYEVVHRLLLDLNDTPGEVYGLVRHMVGSLAISLAYGLPVQRRRDELVELIDSIARMVGEQLVPGKAIVDVLPWLRHIPDWVPGMEFKRFAKSVRWMAVRFKMEGYERALKAFGTAGVRASFLSDALASLDTAGNGGAKHQTLDDVLDVASTVFGAASDTTTNGILIFLFALGTHANVRQQVQKELDSVLRERNEHGKRTLRLPTFEDQDKLPFLMAAIMESQRWAPVAPTGVPHCTTDDDEYRGYFIPKGSVVIPNQWSMLNDEDEYGENVLDYNPSRFIRRKSGAAGETIEINPDVRNPAEITFGFGRRVCPGSHIAQSTIWLAAACLLTVFDFEAPQQKHLGYVGQDGKVDPRFDAGFLCVPKKFKYFRLPNHGEYLILSKPESSVNDPDVSV